MSRYTLSVKPGHDAITRISVGWDRPLSTFFARVHHMVHGCEEELIWKGTYPGELPTPNDAIAVILPYAILLDDLEARLAQDKAKSQSLSDSPLQREMKARFLTQS